MESSKSEEKEVEEEDEAESDQSRVGVNDGVTEVSQTLDGGCGGDGENNGDGIVLVALKYPCNPRKFAAVRGGDSASACAFRPFLSL